MIAGAFLGIKHSTEVDFLRIFAFMPGTISWCGRSGWSFMKTAEGLVTVDVGHHVLMAVMSDVETHVLTYIREVTFGPGPKDIGPRPG